MLALPSCPTEKAAKTTDEVCDYMGQVMINNGISLSASEPVLENLCKFTVFFSQASLRLFCSKIDPN